MLLLVVSQQYLDYLFLFIDFFWKLSLIDFFKELEKEIFRRVLFSWLSFRRGASKKYHSMLPSNCIGCDRQFNNILQLSGPQLVVFCFDSTFCHFQFIEDLVAKYSRRLLNTAMEQIWIEKYDMSDSEFTKRHWGILGMKR